MSVWVKTLLSALLLLDFRARAETTSGRFAATLRSPLRMSTIAPRIALDASTTRMRERFGSEQPSQEHRDHWIRIRVRRHQRRRTPLQQPCVGGERDD